MRRNNLIVLICVLSCICLTFILYNTLSSKDYTYSYIIQKSVSRDLDGMALIISKSSSLDFEDLENYDVATGSKKNNFSVDSKEGIKLWFSKQLFQIISESKTYTEKLVLEDSQYYIIQMNLDYKGGTKSTDIHELYLFVDMANYHIVIPEYYIEPHKLDKVSTNYYDYEPNEVIKSLINQIIQL